MKKAEAHSAPPASPSQSTVLLFTSGAPRSRSDHLRAIGTGNPSFTIHWRFYMPRIVAVGALLICIAYAGPRDKDSLPATHATAGILRAAVAAPGPDTAPAGRPVERYFPAQFPPIQGEVLPHIEAF